MLGIGGRLPKYKPAIHNKRVVELMTEGKTVAAVCAEFGISRTTHDNWVNNYQEYKEAFEYGKECAQARWEQILEDGITGKIKGFNATAMTIAMKRFADYKDKEPPSQVQNNLFLISDSELNKRLMLEAKKSGLLEQLQDEGIIDIRAEDYQVEHDGSDEGHKKGATGSTSGKGTPA